MDLARIKTTLEADNFDVYLRPASAAMPLDQLAVALTGDGDDDNYILQLVYLPGLEGQIAGADLLQHYVQLPARVGTTATGDLLTLLNRLALVVPVGGFGYDPTDNKVFYRYVHVVPKTPRTVDDRIVLETVWLIHFIIDRFTPTITAVSTGQVSGDQALI